ncbi:unnamed protein product [Parascedosporium putredinis]|uniref:Nephrocystin 3-like N-terminal domain-containing protein n=1 Tax=Parascedosporium putredinis TaxID=1442378 RepID=A0A9P1H2E6_9PEZI|nr:unnamed protein product [Parascedosporium putredinis]CAI7993955.1 unnamed protein product [Parascedosporium putredinis]
MTDPLSAASGIAGLISLADIIFIKLVQLRKLWKSAKKAEDDAQILMTQISPYDSSVRLTAVEACYQSLSDIRNKLNAALDKMKSNSGRQRLVEKVKFVFSTDEMTELLVNLSRHQDTFQLAIAADSMSGIIQCLSRGEGVKQQVEEVATDVKRVLDICVRVDMSTRKKNIIEFFMKESPGQAFQTSLKLRHPLTGLWIQRCPEYQCWLKGSTTSLWLAGMMGAGKTVLVGTVIEDALQLSSDRVANPEAFKALEDYHNTLHPSTGILQTSTSEELLAVLEKMSAVLDRIIIVVDGIDEGEKVDEILSILTKISKLCRVSLAVSSRDEVQIREALVEFDELQISATNDDVRLFVMGEMETRIQSRKLRNVGTKMKEEIVDTLITKARGMFRWVACQLDYLCELSTDRQRREAMKSLPPTLPETYIRILERIPLPNLDALSPEQDNRTLALACLNYLQVANFERLVCGDETILFDSELPFHRYAILNWARHAANHLEDDEVFGLMKTLFDPARSAPPNYAWKLNMLPHSGDMSRYGDDKTSISVPSPFELAAIGPEMICTGIYDSPSRELPQDQALWNSKFDSFGITTVRVLDTLQTLRASGMEDTKPPFPRLDHTLNTVIHRAVYLDPSYIIVAVRVILSTVAAVDVSKLPETPLAADSMEWFIRERVWVKYGMQLTYKVDYESLLREAILQLNPLTSEAPFIGRLCYACWEMALSWRLAFTLDPCFVSTAIKVMVSAEQPGRIPHILTLTNGAGDLSHPLREVIATLVRLDTLEAFENANETCAVFSLLEPLPFWSDEGGRNKAMGAIQNKDIIYPLEASILKKLLQMTKYLDNFISSDAAILLHYASILGIRYLAHAEDLVRYLLASGLDVHRRAGRYSPLEVACLAISESADLCDAFASVLSAERLGEANPTEGMAAFHYATLVHRAEVTPMMKALLNCGANVNAPVVKSGVTPLMAAVSLKSVSGAIWLLQHGADPTVSDKTGTCAVSIACNSGYTAFLEYLEGWTSPKTGKPFDWEANSLYYSTRKLKTHLNPLHMACISSNRAVVAFLLERKLVGINNKTHRGYTAMHLAVRFHNAEILSLLVEYGADIGAVDNLGQLPLHWAVAWGYLDAVEFLLSKGSPQTRNYLGKTPLTIAVDGKRLEMITLFENILGEKPADSHGALGLSAAADFFVAAVKRGDVNAVSHGAQEVVNLLLNRGATTADVFPFLIMPDEHDPWHGTVLDLAVIKFASEAILWRLLDRHLEEGENHLNNPPGLLWRAALHENILAINVLTRHLKANIKAYRKNCTTLECSDLFLLANGADVHQPNDVGARPLHIAARSKAQNSDQIMKFLIAAGAAVNVRNIFGNDAISLCGRDPVNREILLSGDAPLSFSTFALQHRPSPFGDFISILDTDAFVLLARHGIDPTSDNGLGAIPAHAAMAQAKVASLLLNGDYGMTELASPRIDFAHPIESSWLGSAFRLYRRRIPEARFKRVLESPVFHGCTCLYWAALRGGNLQAVKVLVRHGAKLLFWDADREISAIDLARESAEVVRWLLVLRHTEQNKIQAAGAEGSEGFGSIL